MSPKWKSDLRRHCSGALPSPPGMADISSGSEREDKGGAQAKPTDLNTLKYLLLIRRDEKKRKEKKKYKFNFNPHYFFRPD